MHFQANAVICGTVNNRSLRRSPRKIAPPPFGLESAQMTQSAKKINCRAKSALHIIIYHIAMPILGKRAAITSRPFSGAFQLIFKLLLCPANFHSREAEEKFCPYFISCSRVSNSSVSKNSFSEIFRHAGFEPDVV